MKKHVEFEVERLKLMSIGVDDFSGTALINESLYNFENKEIFPWNLMVTLSFFETSSDLLPTEIEWVNIGRYRKTLEDKFNPSDKPNVLFLAQICVNGKCDLIWRVHNSDIVDDVLKNEILDKLYEFGYIMTYDDKWLEVESLVDL